MSKFMIMLIYGENHGKKACAVCMQLATSAAIAATVLRHIALGAPATPEGFPEIYPAAGLDGKGKACSGSTRAVHSRRM